MHTVILTTTNQPMYIISDLKGTGTRDYHLSKNGIWIDLKEHPPALWVSKSCRLYHIRTYV